MNRWLCSVAFGALIWVGLSSLPAPALAQSSGEAVYRSKCAMCHGADGIPSAGMSKALGVKPFSDPSVRALSFAQMEAIVINGKGRMKPTAGITAAQVSSVVAYVRTLMK